VEKIIDMQTGLPYIYPVRKQCLIKEILSMGSELQLCGESWGWICGYPCSVKL